MFGKLKKNPEVRIQNILTPGSWIISAQGCKNAAYSSTPTYKIQLEKIQLEKNPEARMKNLFWLLAPDFFLDKKIPLYPVG
ncbi:hypothetical protein ACF3DV_19390 [Chlorogloeopsis fritschii PCC 9212]|uniref:Uncharacterized protein n=1 Tax=Chlorogloeopsis fritschii PCC 6912 TaxID=211165 RepID=A0A433NMQ8_CHLFR|nr:hypothetical protein [Chlorogloeopsis fritschii]RUR84472.1 hypothetical protein PCC6912_13670 [Chlorogloeopsis fritschii PCC 6912]